MSRVPASVRDVILRDGTTLRLRRPVREDGAGLVEFLGRLSDWSLYLRFHGRPRVEAALVAPYLDVDGVEYEVAAERYGFAE